MRKNKIEDYVREEFGMSLFEFMRQKIEDESLYDYEIADQLNVRSQAIGSLRHLFGLKRKNGFRRRFEKRYGRGAVIEFRNMVKDGSNSLADVGRYFGFSREYARQVYIQIFGRPYGGLNGKRSGEGGMGNPCADF